MKDKEQIEREYKEKLADLASKSSFAALMPRPPKDVMFYSRGTEVIYKTNDLVEVIDILRSFKGLWSLFYSSADPGRTYKKDWIPKKNSSQNLNMLIEVKQDYTAQTIVVYPTEVDCRVVISGKFLPSGLRAKFNVTRCNYGYPEKDILTETGGLAELSERCGQSERSVTCYFKDVELFAEAVN